MSKPILLYFFIIFKYQCLGIKKSCDMAFYDMITLKPIIAMYHAVAAVMLVLSAFLLLPIALVINAVSMGAVYVFNRSLYSSSVTKLEEVYKKGANKTKTEYDAYVDSLD